MPPTKRAISISSSSSDSGTDTKPSSSKRQKTLPLSTPVKNVSKGKGRAPVKAEDEAAKDEERDKRYPDWPAPRGAMQRAREFLLDIAEKKRKVMLVPDKDADGLSAGYVLYQTLVLLGIPPTSIYTHILSKGTNVHTASEVAAMEALVEKEGIERVVVLDQGSRQGVIVGNLPDGGSGLLLIDHHLSDEFPPSAVVLTACRTEPIATTSLLTYLLCKPLHPGVKEATDWAALMGVVGDLGPGIKWGEGAWPAEMGLVGKRYGSKTIGDAVSLINAPRRTGEYNVMKAWEIYLEAKSPTYVANHAWLKLCRMDVNQAIEQWGRQPPKFSADGKVALIRVDSGFQVHPVIATKWAGVLRKAKTLVMVMCANTGFNPDPSMMNFSCRVSAGLRDVPDDEKPNLIELLKSYGDAIEGFRERVGDDFARGHKEATGGIISKSEFENLLLAMGIDENRTPTKKTSATKTGKGKVIDAAQKNGIKDFFKVSPMKKEVGSSSSDVP